MRGDGTTIGKGAQRTTRDVREYTWNSLRIIDTPGIGAYEGDEDRAQALSVIDQTDVVLFLASSDGIQEESFKGMQELRQQNKPLLFVLNVKRDLEKPVNMRRFLKDPRTVFDDDELRGHFDRIYKLAGDYLGMRDIRIIPIHAQAAYLSTRPEYGEHANALAEHSRLGDLLDELKSEVSQRGTVRRVQTIVDGTQICLLDLQEELGEQAKTVRRYAQYLEDKFSELDVWLDGFVRATNARAETEAAQLVHPLRASVSSFIDENIEREDVGDRWNRKVKGLDIEGWLKRQQTAILDELRGRLVEFSREMSVESKLIGEFDGEAISVRSVGCEALPSLGLGCRWRTGWRRRCGGLLWRSQLLESGRLDRWWSQRNRAWAVVALRRSRAEAPAAESEGHGTDPREHRQARTGSRERPEEVVLRRRDEPAGSRDPQGHEAALQRHAKRFSLP